MTFSDVCKFMMISWYLIMIYHWVFYFYNWSKQDEELQYAEAGRKLIQIVFMSLALVLVFLDKCIRRNGTHQINPIDTAKHLKSQKVDTQHLKIAARAA